METQRLLLQIECRKRVVVATVLPEKDRDGTRMLYDLAGNRTELVDYRTQADTLCTDGLVMLQRFVDAVALSPMRRSVLNATAERARKALFVEKYFEV